jgi:hypothetical protein
VAFRLIHMHMVLAQALHHISHCFLVPNANACRRNLAEQQTLEQLLRDLSLA